MAEQELDTGLAIELFGSICAGYDVELSDLVHIVGRLRQADDLKNVSAVIHEGDHRENWDKNMVLRATYTGTEPFWAVKCYYRENYDGEVTEADAEARKYFDDLGSRVGVQFQNPKFLENKEPQYGNRHNGHVLMRAHALVPSGRALQVRINQYYTYADRNRA